MTTEVKLYEARDAIERGATEIDMVINLRALQAGATSVVRDELAGLAEICRAVGVVSKAILETCYLTVPQKLAACEIALEAGLDFVKTSTGFGPAGATPHDVRLMREIVGPDVGVKAAGGIRTLADALAMVEAGATRIGTSSAVAIMREMVVRTSGPV
jgi:deoxyribose-phosphate aldolase